MMVFNFGVQTIKAMTRNLQSRKHVPHLNTYVTTRSVEDRLQIYHKRQCLQHNIYIYCDSCSS